METTYRLVLLDNTEITGRTAATEELAKLVPGELAHHREKRLGIEMTEWAPHFEKMRPVRSVLINVETTPNEWTLGA
jgi:hypothetical protein